VIKNLCDQGGGGNATVAYFYLDFADGGGQSPVRILSSLLKQLVLDRRRYRGHAETERLLVRGMHRKFPLFQKCYTIPVPMGAFICINGLDQCAAEHCGGPPDRVNEPVE